jgi:tetratricopeptide (TPR) repeat protein
VLAQNHSFALRTLGRDEEAKARCQQVLEFDPDYEPCMEDIAMAELALGNLEGAEAMFARQAAISNPSAAGQGRELVQALAGKGDKKALAVRYSNLPFNSRLDPDSGNSLEDFHLAPLLAMLGEREIALDYLERFASEVGSTADWSIMLPTMDPIRCEPRFVAVVKKVGTRDPHFSRVCDGESP